MTEFVDLWNKAQEIIKNKVNLENVTEYERSDLIIRLAMHFNKEEKSGGNLIAVPKMETKEPRRDTDQKEYFVTEKGSYPKRLPCEKCGKTLAGSESKRDPGTYYYRCGSCEHYTNPSVSNQGR